MRTTLLILGLALAAGCHSAPATTPAAPQTNEPAQAQALGDHALFDFYVLSLSWSPEFCHSHPAAAECARRSRFVLHGLWPERADNSYPENCSTAPGPANPGKYLDVYPDEGLLRHEWRKHGTCSGLSPNQYFDAARAAFHSVTIPPRLEGLTEQISMPPDDILALFTAANPRIPRDSLTLSCGNNYLTAVSVCLNKKLQPVACGAMRSCRARTVRIPPP
jgi:ribonuclease T2